MSGAYRDLWITSFDGLRLHARSYGDPDAASAVVCLPGLARHAGDFDELARALTAAGEPSRHVLAIDYRGRGLSEHDPDPTHYTVETEITDLLALLGELGIARAIFVGTSRGGLITMALGAGRPELLRGAVLNDIGPVIELEGLLRIKGYVGRLPEPSDLEHGARTLRDLFGPQFPNLRDEDWRSWAASTWTATEKGLVLTYDPALARTLDPIDPDTKMPDLWSLFDTLGRLPVLVIRGALSDLLSAETAAAMARRHAGLRLVTVPDEGHAPLMRGPVAAAVLRFVEEVESGVIPEPRVPSA